MKKTVLCIFSLILYLLVACTILCAEIEDTMATHVIAIADKCDGSIPINLRETSVFRDENGPHLYEVTEGMGWKTGPLVSEVDENYYDPDGMTYFIYTDRFYYITSASRQPRDGEVIIVMADQKDLVKQKDTYLLYYPNGVPDFEALVAGGDMGENMLANYLLTKEKIETLDKGEKAWVIRYAEGVLPYTEQTARTNLGCLARGDWRIYRMADIERAVVSLPLIALIIVVVALPVVIWAFTCVLARKEDENEKLIRINVGIVGGLLILLLILTKILDLPLSLMPLDNIFDMTHYRELFGVIFGLLSTMSAGQSVLTLSKWMEILSYALLGLGAAAAVGFVAVECRLVRKK